jgi:membrane-bound lytic murein transglycosylase B
MRRFSIAYAKGIIVCAALLLAKHCAFFRLNQKGYPMFAKLSAVLAVACLSLNTYAMTQEQFIEDMNKRHGFGLDYLRQFFAQTEVKNAIIKAMDRPSEALPWSQYYPRFVNPERIEGGKQFLKEYQTILAKAERIYGVPPAIIAAIAGVETIYGKNTGSYRVADALTTLAFHYPKRANFFRGELEEFLLMVREEQLPPLGLKGSYAGAMGIGQFIPSSYRRFSVDFDNNGRRDLHNIDDAIGSIAHYLQQHGWQSGGTVVLPAEIEGDPSALLALELKPQHSLQHLRGMGLIVAGEVPATAAATVIQLETESGPAYWAAFDNFYSITRYNRSTRYAMAVYLLAEAIEAPVTTQASQ